MVDDIVSCFECEVKENIIHHHVVPRSLGGKKTIPLCQSCHDKVHRLKRFRNISISNLTKEGLQRAREKGVKLGSRDPEKSVKLMNIASVKAKKEFRSKMNPIINELRKNGCKTLKSFADRLNEMKMFTRTGKKWTPGSINNLIYNQ
jgi:hypothetical protein